MNRTQKVNRAVVLVAGLASAGFAQAEEGGSGHYMPGSMASFIDSVPTAPTFITRLNVINYEGSVSPRIALPFGGMLATGIDASITGVGVSMVWRPDWTIAEGWSYAMSSTIPLIKSDVSASATIPAERGVDLSDTETGLGDIIIQPIMLSHTVNPDFKFNTRVTVYTPTGNYTAGKLANTGKNFWTLSPSAEFMYMGQKNGIEASLFAGVDFNTENNDTDYRSGTQFHLDGTLAQHFPLWGGLAGAGISGFYYQQISADSGSGAKFGDFEAKTVGIGPALSYGTKVGEHSVTGELKWLHEIDAENRLKGDTIFFKLLGTF